MVRRIDAYSHVQTEEILDRLDTVHNNIEIDNFRNAPRLFRREERIDHLDKYSIDKQIISQAVPIWYDADPAKVFDVVKFANDEIRRVADEYPDRFVPIGTLPFLEEKYIDEVNRCVKDLDMVGVQILSHINGAHLDSQRFRPFWETVNELEVPVWIHPQLYQWHDFETRDTWIYKMLGWPFDTSVAVVRLVLNGVLDQFKNVKLITHHLGGVIPYLEERMLSWVQTRSEDPEMHTDVDLAELSEPVESYFERVYGDLAISCRGKKQTLRCGYEFFGEDNTLFGVDYPFGPQEGEYWMDQTISVLEDMDFSRSQKEKIYHKNIEELLNI